MGGVLCLLKLLWWTLEIRMTFFAAITQKTLQLCFPSANARIGCLQWTTSRASLLTVNTRSQASMLEQPAAAHSLHFPHPDMGVRETKASQMTASSGFSICFNLAWSECGQPSNHSRMFALTSMAKCRHGQDTAFVSSWCLHLRRTCLHTASGLEVGFGMLAVDSCC